MTVKVLRRFRLYGPRETTAMRAVAAMGACTVEHDHWGPVVSFDDLEALRAAVDRLGWGDRWPAGDVLARIEVSVR